MHILDLEGYSHTFNSNQKRLAARKDLHGLITKAFMHFDFDKITQLMTEFRIPFGHVKNMAQAMRTAAEEGLILTDNDSDNQVITMKPFSIS